MADGQQLPRVVFLRLDTIDASLPRAVAQQCEQLGCKVCTTTIIFWGVSVLSKLNLSE